MLNNGIFNGFEKLKNMTEIEQKIKEALLIRGFKNETILNNRGLIGAVIDETILKTVKNTVALDSINSRLIDKVTVKNLGLAFRMVGISCNEETIDKVIDLVELIEDKGDDTSMKDICKLEGEW